MNGTGNNQYISADPVPRYGYRDSRWGFTYFMRRGAFIKIGHSANPSSRSDDLQVNFPDEIEILAVIPDTVLREEDAHRKFWHLRKRGEWFRPEPELVEFIERISPAAKEMVRRHEQRRALKDLMHSYENAHPSCKGSLGLSLRRAYADHVNENHVTT
jgi:Meiotically up-regulated gene 113